MKVKLDMVGIVVKDMKASLDFYRSLGFSIPESSNNEPHAEINQDGFRLGFDTVDIAKSVYGSWDEPTGHRIELAFLCESNEELNKLYNQIIEKGYESHKEPWDAFWGQRYAIVKDPDGNLISLFV
ncbi:VOC family protein [Alkalicoccobacillus murimartini]|uniref:Glyoxalase superfamily protein PhnB n=1 Tax=Alkalicoccobacillus murimartini TaxID=171685 RepID=A0ABT9YMC3_9BACI|nr:VOC family protein [Alkalicoccobacillus murimartini]MDQ0208794.1 putative glyoxalase superfamily protein PhnB [Alkalicoccobacillus murimartini]